MEESRLAAVKQGASIGVTIDAIDTPLTGRVAEIAPSVDPGSRAFLAKIDLPAHPALRGGLFGRARFATGQRQVLAVPRAAVVAQGQLQTVMVEEGGRLVRAQLYTDISNGSDGGFNAPYDLNGGGQDIDNWAKVSTGT